MTSKIRPTVAPRSIRLIQFKVIDVSRAPKATAALIARQTVRALTVASASPATPSKVAGQKLTGANPAAVAAPAAAAPMMPQGRPGDARPDPAPWPASRELADPRSSGRRATRLASSNCSSRGGGFSREPGAVYAVAQDQTRIDGHTDEVKELGLGVSVAMKKSPLVAKCESPVLAS